MKKLFAVAVARLPLACTATTPSRAQRLLTKYGASSPEIEAVTTRLTDIPVDITPVFAAAGASID